MNNFAAHFFRGDRYHYVMADWALWLWEVLGLQRNNRDTWVRFYATERKVPYAVALGHEQLFQSLIGHPLDYPRQRFLADDKAALTRVASLLRQPYAGEVRMLPPATLYFAKQPILDVHGDFAQVQMGEVPIEHVLDLFGTFAFYALDIKLASAAADQLCGFDLADAVDLDQKRALTGRPSLSNFALRRLGDPFRSLVASEVSQVCGWDDTSDVEAGFETDTPTMGTHAHYGVQLAKGLMQYLLRAGKVDGLFDEKERPKHFQRWMFETWLDKHPNGTTLLVDTLDLKLGLRHAVEAANSSPARRKALKFVRVDSRYPPAAALYARRFLDANGFSDVGVIVTGDLDAAMLRVMTRLGLVFGGRITYLMNGVGIGTKYGVEFNHVAGAIFKMTECFGIPTGKLSDSKSTFPGWLQVRRFSNAMGIITRQDTVLQDEPVRLLPGEYYAVDLLEPFYGGSGVGVEMKNPLTINEKRTFLWEQIFRLQLPIAEFARERVGISPALKDLMATLANDAIDLNETGVVFPVEEYDECWLEIRAAEERLGISTKS
ncbi:MAG: hypothetical protein AAB486_00415 [Patescibacteria group bacterium]